MRRAVICHSKPHTVIPQLPDYSLMVINPNAPKSRLDYLVGTSDYSLLITDTQTKHQNGGSYPGERVLWYTSGTTGDSKFCRFSQDQIDLMAKTICHAYQIGANDRYYGIMPLWHAHGQGFYWATQLAGCHAEFGSIKDKSEIEQLQPTFVTSIPDMMSVIMRLNLRHLRFLRTASSAMPKRLNKTLQQTFKIPVIEAFGMTEALGHCFTNPLHGEQKIGTVGLPSGIEARVDTDQHLWIRGPSVHARDWLDTGDLATCDQDGYFSILGRSMDRINIRGFKIDPLSIENQLYSRFTDIRECVVFGTNRLNCLYVGHVDPKEIADFLQSLGSACRARVLRQVDEIPKNTNGKVSRASLNQLFT